MSKYLKMAERLEQLSDHVDRALFPNDDTCDDAAALLREAAKLEAKLSDPGTTHAEGCWSWGPRHYECAERRIAELEALTVLMWQWGYARGHDDTVEGAYNPAWETEPDAALAALEGK